ncbi:MAG: IPT/TIG domain-containing protein [Kofleriaceae bacterium]|nr:IPT/TIG domain-containing protein [Kofleriaceae bacterium]
MRKNTAWIGLSLLLAASCGDTPKVAPDAPPSAVNECISANPCVAKAVCADTATAYTCTCNTGFTGDGTKTGTGCTDVNECTAGTACAPGASCTNTDGAFSCACPEGFSGDGTAAGGCADVNECATANPCTTNANCTNTVGAFSCACNVGFVGEGTPGGVACTDVNECAAPVCGTSECANTVGNFRCEQTLGVSPFQNTQFRIDPTTYGCRVDLDGNTGCGGNALPHHALTVTGLTPTGINAVATYDATGEIYAIVKTATARTLVKMDPLVGPNARDITATVIGTLADKFSTIAILPGGTMFGTTGNGATVKESLYSIDRATAASTLIGAFPAGADGEVLCYNTDDLMMYRFTGNSTVRMEKFDVANATAGVAPTVTVVTAALTPGGEIFGCHYEGTLDIGGTATQVFRLTNINSATRYVSAAGDAVTVNATVTAPDDLRAIFALPHQLYTATPATGPIAGGTTVTLTGAALMGVTDVKFNGVAATVVDSTLDGSLVVTSPMVATVGPAVITAKIPTTEILVRWNFEYTATFTSWSALPQVLLTSVKSRMMSSSNSNAAPVVDTAGLARRQAKGK